MYPLALIKGQWKHHIYQHQQRPRNPAPVAETGQFQFEAADETKISRLDDKWMKKIIFSSKGEKIDNVVLIHELIDQVSRK